MTASKIKTATPTPEASAIEANTAAKAALITAEEKVQTLSIAVDEADLGMDEITDGWDHGDDTASAADYSLAQIEFKRATALHDGCPDHRRHVIDLASVAPIFWGGVAVVEHSTTTFKPWQTGSG